MNARSFRSALVHTTCAAFVLLAPSGAAAARGDAPADGPVISVQPAGVQLAPGETATVRIWLDPRGQRVDGAALELAFDADVLQVDSVRPGELLGDGAVQGKGSPRIDNRGGKVRFEAAAARDRSGAAARPGALCEITLRMGDERTAATVPLRIRRATLLDADGRKVGDVDLRHDGEVEQARFAGARVVHDPATGLPRQVVGIHAMPRLLAAGELDPRHASAARVYLDFLDEHADLFGVDTADLRLAATERVDDHWLYVFRQVYETLPVHHAVVSLLTDSAGEVLAYHANYVPDLSVKTRTRVDLEEAAAAARATYGEGGTTGLARHDAALVIHVDRSTPAPEPHLAWRFLLARERPDPARDAIFFVDARDGTVLHSYPRFVPAVLQGTVTGEVYAENPGAPPADHAPLAHLQGTAARAPITTDAAGRYAVGGLIAGSYDLDVSLDGPYAHVRDHRSGEITTSIRCHTDEVCDLAWSTSDEDGLNVFFHVNGMHDWFERRMGYAWTNGWDGTTQFAGEVNVGQADNAWAGDTLLFGADAFARSRDVVYHECAHNVLHALYGDWVGFSLGDHGEGYALDEGFADYFAAAATEDPRVGEGAGAGRDLADVARYPGKHRYALEGHDGGAIIGSAAWSLRARLAAEMGGDGARLADRLLFEAHRRMAAQPREFFFTDPQESNLLTSLYLAADDDHDLAGGVPHFGAIQRTFHAHGLLQAVLRDGDSYDVSANLVSAYAGGDFYVANGRLFGDNPGQRGLRALGDLGALPLDAVELVDLGYSRTGVAAVPGRTYVTRAGDGRDGGPIVVRVTDVDAETGTVTVAYLVRDRQLVLRAGQGFDFDVWLAGGAADGDLYLSGTELYADRGGQRGLVALGDLGDTPLERVVSPPSGYRSAGAPVVPGHVYVARAAAGEEGREIVLRVLDVDGGEVTLEAIQRPVGGVLLYDRESYDFGARRRGRREGGSLYLVGGELRADRDGQRGVVDLGELGDTPLHKVTPPDGGYARDGIPAIAGHTYAALPPAGTEGEFVVFRVDARHGDAAALRYTIRTPGVVTLYDGDGYRFATEDRGAPGDGELHLAGGQLWADRDGQRGVIDLGDLGEAPLEDTAIPATGYARSGVATAAGHTYVALARDGEGPRYVVFRLREVGDTDATLEWRYLTPGRVTLGERESFDFSEGIGGQRRGGELYVTRGKFYANDRGQRGVLDLGEPDEADLAAVEIPDARFSRYGVPIVVGHTYAALAGRGEEGNHVLFRVEAVDGDRVTLRYHYRTP